MDAGYGPAMAAVGPDNELRLLVPTAGLGGASVPEDTGRMALCRSALKRDGKLTYFLDLTLTDPALNGVFTELAIDILSRLEKGFSPENAVFGTIEDFRLLLSPDAETLVPESKVLGLVGELFLLERLCRSAPDAVRTWTGPRTQRHDFRRADRAIETKTSSRADATRVTIHGAEQLAPPAGGTLHLAHLRLERSADGDLGVARLWRRILDLGADRKLLAELIAETGCEDPESLAWNTVSWQSEGLDIYHVIEGFPRISATSFPGEVLPAGISALSYDVDLSVAGAFQLSPNDADQLLEEFAA